MNIGIVYCLFFLIYGLINTYLALLLRSMGYDSGEIGLLLGVFETAGAVLPLLVSAKIDTNGKYGLALVLLGIISATALLPLISFSFIILTVVCLCLFALGTKGAVPLLDSFTAKRLGDKSSDYGKIRALGSLGFVSMTLFLQFTSVIRQDNIASIIIGFAVSGSIFTCSLFFLKDIFVPLPVPKRENTGKNIFSFFLKKDADSAERFSKSFWFGLFLIFLGFLGMVPSQRFFSLYVEEYLHLQSYAGLWALSAMAEIPLMFLSGKFIRKFGIPKLIIFVLLTISIRNLTYIAIPTFTGAVIAQLMHAFNFGLFHPVAVLFCVIHAPKKAASLGMTLYSVAAVGLAYIIGSILGGYIIQFFGYPALFGVFSLFPFIGIVLALTSNLLT